VKKEAAKGVKKEEKKPASNGKPLASIFAKPAKKEEPVDEDKAFINDDEEGEDEISDEELEEQEEKAAVKLWVLKLWAYPLTAVLPSSPRTSSRPLRTRGGRRASRELYIAQKLTAGCRMLRLWRRLSRSRRRRSASRSSTS
jgi:hypothetical protein